MQLDTKEVRQGWAFVKGGRKRHYFIGDVSLCGKWGFTAIRSFALIQCDGGKLDCKDCSDKAKAWA